MQTKIIDDLTFKNIVGIANNNLIFTEELISTRLLWEDLKIEYGYYENRKNRTKKDKNNIINKINYRLMKVQSHYKNINDFKSHNNDVVFSCMSLILAYTGMRISEVLSMPVDCLKKKKTHCDDIEYDIYYIKSTTFKYETNAEGVKNTNDMRSEWLANGEVAKAVDVLQRLYQKDRERSNCDFLFCSVKGDNVKQLSYSYTDEKIKILVNDKTFNIHQFRRTFARFVARSAFGEVDILKEHFKHKTREITEYYMNGDIDNEFLEMIDEDQSEIKKSILWDQLLQKAKEDFGDELEEKLKGTNND